MTSDHYTQRSTPTCVGRTAPRLSPGSTVTEHPHVCGEDWLMSPWASNAHGAPPRVWGGHFATCVFIRLGSGFASGGSWCRMAVVAC